MRRLFTSALPFATAAGVAKRFAGGGQTFGPTTDMERKAYEAAKSDLPSPSPRSEGPEAPTDPPVRRTEDETEKWWPVDNKWTGRVRRDYYSPSKPLTEGMMVPDIKQVPDQGKPEEISFAGDTFFAAPQMMMNDGINEREKFLAPASTFDPALDDIEETEFMQDTRIAKDIQEAAHADKKRLEAFGNPITVEDQLDYLMTPSREGQEVQQQRDEFNGFLHWGLLYAATIAVDQEQDFKKAHQFVNRYLRDMDLFAQWLKHPKVVAHMQKKFNFDVAEKFDKLLAVALSLFVRSKIQALEGDHTGALKSLVGAAGMIHEGGKLEDPRHRKVLGAVLSCRGMVYAQLKSYERAEDDLTRSLSYLPAERCASVFQVRAECREAMGKLDDARDDEEHAADIWEKAETLHPGMDHPPVKWVI